MIIFLVYIKKKVLTGWFLITGLTADTVKRIKFCRHNNPKLNRNEDRITASFNQNKNCINSNGLLIAFFQGPGNIYLSFSMIFMKLIKGAVFCPLLKKINGIRLIEDVNEVHIC
ncbi:MAG: hypothetical protein JXB49_33700 [Bacteroidales bacterium]|nr:hypothetical protein [Bacteroidales bacterium]